MMDWFVDFFSNPLNIIMGLILLLIGVIIGVVFYRYLLPAKNQILYCRERDGRGLELNIINEDAISLETKSSPPLRFFKFGRSYEFRKRGRAFTRFFGKEGTAYSWRLEGFSKVPTKFKGMKEKVPVLNEKGRAILDEKGFPVFKEVVKKVPVEWKEKEINLEFPTLEDAVKSQWGEEFYATVPDKMKGLLRENNLLVTVNLEPGIVPVGYEPITESIITKKGDEDMASLIARGVKGVLKTPYLDYIFIAGFGFGVALALQIIGVLRI